MNSLVVNAAGLLADERDDTAGFVAAGGQSGSAASAPLKAKVISDQTKTSQVTAQISPQARPSSPAAATARRQSLTSATACSPTSPT